MSKQKTIKKRDLKPKSSEAFVIYDGIKTQAKREAHTAIMSGVGLREGSTKIDSYMKHIQDSPIDKAHSYSDVLSYIVDAKEEEMDDMIKSISRFAK